MHRTDRQTDRHAYEQTDRQTNREVGRLVDHRAQLAWARCKTPCEYPVFCDGKILSRVPLPAVQSEGFQLEVVVEKRKGQLRTRCQSST